MAKERTKDEELPSGQSPPELSADESDVIKLNSLLDDNDLLNGYVLLKRRPPDGGAYAYVCRMELEEFRVMGLEGIRLMYGGGDYLLQGYTQDGKRLRSARFAVDYRLKGRLDATGDATPRGGDGTMGQALAFLEKKLPVADDSKELLKMMLAKGEQSSRDMLAMMQQSSERQMQMMTAMIAAIAQRPAPAQLDYMPIILEMIRRPDSGAGKIGEFVELMKQAKALVTGQDDKEPDTWERIASLAAPAIGGFLSGFQRTKAMLSAPPTPPTPPTPPATPPAANPPGATATTASPSPPPDEKFAGYIRMLFRAAQLGSNPESYADLIEDSLSEPEMANLREFLRQPDWLAKLFPQAVPGMNDTIAAWFTELRNLLLEDENNLNTHALGHSAELQNSGASTAISPNGAIGPVAGKAGAGNGG